jgi:putative intracellular protease/amidase
MKLFKQVLLASILFVTLINAYAATNVEVKNIGELKQIATSQLNGKVPFKSLLQDKQLYGLGMETGMDSEVLILANKPYVGGFRKMAYQYPLSDNPNLSFLVYSYVDKWQSITLPDDINNFQKLETFLPEMAKKAGLDSEKPFPFLINAQADFLQWFVVDGAGNNMPDAQTSFLRGRYLGGLNDVKIEGLGFYSSKHQGVFTAPKNNMHIHFKTIPQNTNETIFVGHLDGNIQLKKGTVIQLPATQLRSFTMNAKKKVLMVVTSHSALGNTGKATGLYFDELATPYYALADNAIEVVIASPLGGKTPIVPSSLGDDKNRPENVAKFMQDKAAMHMLNNAVKLADIDATQFDGIFLAGGHGTMFDLPNDKDLANILGKMFDANKVIGAVCHGPAGLVSAKRADGKSILFGKKVNGFTNSEEEKVGLTSVVPFLLENKMTELGGIYEKVADFAEHAVQDGNLITGQNPASAAKAAALFAQALL